MSQDTQQKTYTAKAYNHWIGIVQQKTYTAKRTRYFCFPFWPFHEQTYQIFCRSWRLRKWGKSRTIDWWSSTIHDYRYLVLHSFGYTYALCSVWSRKIVCVRNEFEKILTKWWWKYVKGKRCGEARESEEKRVQTFCNEICEWEQESPDIILCSLNLNISNKIERQNL